MQTPRLLLQVRGKVRDYGHGLADLLGDAVEKDSLAVGSDVVDVEGSGIVGDQGLSGSELQRAAGVLYRHGKKIEVGVEVKELFAVAAPSGQFLPP